MAKLILFGAFFLFVSIIPSTKNISRTSSISNKNFVDNLKEESRKRLKATVSEEKITSFSSSPSPVFSIERFILGEINKYRESQNLPLLRTDNHTCSFALLRAGEISVNFNHDGFTERKKSNTLPYPSYIKIVENLANNFNYKDVISSWIASSGHAENLRADITYGCIGISGNNYVFEGWKP